LIKIKIYMLHVCPAAYQLVKLSMFLNAIINALAVAAKMNKIPKAPQNLPPQTVFAWKA